MDSEQVGTDLAVPESKSEEGRLQSGGDGEDTNLPKVKIITSCRQRFLSNIMRLWQWGQNSLTFSNTLQFHSFHSFMSINRQTPQPCPPLCADVRYISRGAPPWETDQILRFSLSLTFSHCSTSNDPTPQRFGQTCAVHASSSACSYIRNKCKIKKKKKKKSWKAVSDFWTPMYSQTSSNQVCQCLSNPRSTISSRLRSQKFCEKYSRCWEILCIQCVGMCWNDELDV